MQSDTQELLCVLPLVLLSLGVSFLKSAFSVYLQCTILRQVVVVMGAGIGKSVKYRYFQCTILRQVVVVMGAGIGKSVKYRLESPSRRTSAAKLHIPQR
jgi:hypothetical protein